MLEFEPAHSRCSARAKPTLRTSDFQKSLPSTLSPRSPKPCILSEWQLALGMLSSTTDEVARNGTLLRLTRPEDLLSVSLLLGNPVPNNVT